jgi:TATA-binding protein-associated factor
VHKILPFLHSRSHETRTAASNALSQIFSSIPVWEPSYSPDATMKSSGDANSTPEFPNFSVKDLMERGTLLLASSGKEFLKSSAILANSSEVKKARKEAMGRLGLDFLDGLGGDEMDLEKELAGEPAEPDIELENGVKIEEEAKSPQTAASPSARSKSSTPAPPAPNCNQPLDDVDLSGLSARERNRLKRKRKAGNSAFVSAPPPQSSGSKYTAQSAGQPNKYARLVITLVLLLITLKRARLIAKEEHADTPKLDDLHSNGNGISGPFAEKVVIDPSKGGAVNPKNSKQSKALEVQPGCWIWDGIAKVLEVDLFSQAWEARHGAAMCLRELLKVQGKHGGMKGMTHFMLSNRVLMFLADGLNTEDNAIAHERWCNNLAAKLLCVSILDRFGDFVSDQVWFLYDFTQQS